MSAPSPGPAPDGLTVVVTGASSGIGAAIARDLHARGHRVVIAARREEQLEALARDLSPAGHRVLPVRADVTLPEDRERLLSRAREVFGPIDVLVNNAGVGGTRGTPAWERRDDAARLLDVNLSALVHLSLLAVPDMTARRRGHIVNIASVSGLIATEPLYSASKFGVRGFSLALRRQLLGTGVHVGLVSPGFVRSEMTADLGPRLPGPEIVARAVAGLLERPRREVVVPGYYLPLVALDRALPGLGDLVVGRVLRRRR